jgi:hypothetical protein
MKKLIGSSEVKLVQNYRRLTATVAENSILCFLGAQYKWYGNGRLVAPAS